MTRGVNIFPCVLPELPVLTQPPVLHWSNATGLSAQITGFSEEKDTGSPPSGYSLELRPEGGDWRQIQTDIQPFEGVLNKTVSFVERLPPGTYDLRMVPPWRHGGTASHSSGEEVTTCSSR